MNYTKKRSILQYDSIDPVSHFHPSLLFVGKAGAYPSGSLLWDSRGEVNTLSYNIGVFVTVSHFHPSLLFVGKAGAYPSGALHGTQLNTNKRSFLQHQSICYCQSLPL
jgi:hypothetical protein